MKDKIRTPDLLFGAIDNARAGIIAPLEIIEIYDEFSR